MFLKKILGFSSSEEKTPLLRSISKVQKSIPFPEWFALKKDSVTVGRDKNTSDLVLDSTKHPRMISRVHAIITKKTFENQTRWVIEDKNSVNGIFVNNVRVSNSQLKNGDRLTFGGGCAVKVGETREQPDSEFEFIFEEAGVMPKDQALKNQARDLGSVQGDGMCQTQKYDLLDNLFDDPPAAEPTQDMDDVSGGTADENLTQNMDAPVQRTSNTDHIDTQADAFAVDTADTSNKATQDMADIIHATEGATQDMETDSASNHGDSVKPTQDMGTDGVSESGDTQPMDIASLVGSADAKKPGINEILAQSASHFEREKDKTLTNKKPYCPVLAQKTSRDAKCPMLFDVDHCQKYSHEDSDSSLTKQPSLISTSPKKIIPPKTLPNSPTKSQHSPTKSQQKSLTPIPVSTSKSDSSAHPLQGLRSDSESRLSLLGLSRSNGGARVRRRQNRITQDIEEEKKKWKENKQKKNKRKKKKLKKND